MAPRHHSAILIAAVTALAPLLAGCGSGPAETAAAPPPPPKPTASTGTPAAHVDELTVLPPAGQVRVMGMVMSRMNAGSPPEPVADGVVMAMPASQFAAMADGTTGPWKGAVQRGAAYPLPDDTLVERGVTACWLDEDGTYHLSLAPGDYVFCLGNLGGSRAGVQGLWIERSFPVTVTDEDVQTVVPLIDRATKQMTLLE